MEHSGRLPLVAAGGIFSGAAGGGWERSTWNIRGGFCWWLLVVSFRGLLASGRLLAVGDDELIKIHYHTNEPWKVLEYCSTLGEIYDIVVEDMDRQSRGLKG